MRSVRLFNLGIRGSSRIGGEANEVRDRKRGERFAFAYTSASRMTMWSRVYFPTGKGFIVLQVMRKPSSPSSK
jgi:hypothetical protein